MTSDYFLKKAMYRKKGMRAQALSFSLKANEIDGNNKKKSYTVIRLQLYGIHLARVFDYSVAFFPFACFGIVKTVLLWNSLNNLAEDFKKCGTVK